jgi:hypothetical protein
MLSNFLLPEYFTNDAAPALNLAQLQPNRLIGLITDLARVKNFRVRKAQRHNVLFHARVFPSILDE